MAPHQPSIAERRYLDLLRAALVNELYLDQEMRIERLTAQLEGRQPVASSEYIRDPARENPGRYQRLLVERQNLGGGPRKGGVADAHSRHGSDRFRGVERELLESLPDLPPGPVVYCGADGLAVYVRAVLDVAGEGDRSLYVVDPFRAVDPASEASDTTEDVPFEDLRRDLNLFRDLFDRYNLLSDTVVFVQGEPDSVFVDEFCPSPAFVVVDWAAMPQPLQAFRAMPPRMAAGSRLVVLGRGQLPSAAIKATKDPVVQSTVTRPDCGGLAWTVRADWDAAISKPRFDQLRRPPVVADDGTIDLSIVVCMYNMPREAARTLLSLSRVYQRGADHVDYEVVVVENGSSPEGKLGEQYVRTFGPEFRYLDMGDGAPSSPTVALNTGIAASRGRSVGVMIDGAHVLTPGVVALSQQALAWRQDAVVVVQQWYVGPGQQGSTVMAGYDQAAEDELFRRISWPADGYRLFEISHPIADRDWFDKVGESNCLIVPRRYLLQSGGVDDSFDLPGGEYSNLEFFERMTSTPGAKVVKILGEASFHQVHGGTTTNVEDSVGLAAQIAGYHDHFKEIRGRAFRGSRKDLDFIGAVGQSALRTRPRRLVAPLFRGRDDLVDGAKPAAATPVPDELRTEFVAAYYDSLAWERILWLGHEVDICATDLFAYQAIMVATRPDVVITIGDGSPGRDLFIAGVMDQLGEGEVIRVGTTVEVDHARVHDVAGGALDDGTLAAIRDLVGGRRAMVVMGLAPLRTLRVQLDAYAPFVRDGDYLIVENTIVNGHPVRVGYGTGPREAVDMFVARNRDFGIDTRIGDLVLSFNHNGYLRRFTAT